MIRIENLHKTYYTGKVAVHALRGISFEISEGEFVAIMGPSGSGKSTLMHILGCLDKPTSGSYFLNGEIVSSKNDDELAIIRNRKIGFVFQALNLIPRRSALNQVIMPLLYNSSIRIDKKKMKEKAYKILQQVGLGEDRTHHTPAELSGGQQQRVAIARALINDPLIILADEPTGSLDTRSSEAIMLIFQKLNKDGKTIILVTHEEDIAHHTRRIIKLKDGHIVSEENIKDPIDANSVLKNIPLEEDK